MGPVCCLCARAYACIACMPACVSVCLFACLCACLRVSLPVCLSVSVRCLCDIYVPDMADLSSSHTYKRIAFRNNENLFFQKLKVKPNGNAMLTVAKKYSAQTVRLICAQLSKRIELEN